MESKWKVNTGIQPDDAVLVTTATIDMQINCDRVPAKDVLWSDAIRNALYFVHDVDPAPAIDNAFDVPIKWSWFVTDHDANNVSCELICNKVIQFRVIVPRYPMSERQEICNHLEHIYIRLNSIQKLAYIKNMRTETR